MYVSDLAVNNFRSYREAVIRFHPGINLLVGRNGQGKTNLLEALQFLGNLGSHRTSSAAAVLRMETSEDDSNLGTKITIPSPTAVIRARTVNQGRENVLELALNQVGRNQARINRQPVATRELIGKLPTVIFAPEDLQIMRAEPGLRRRLLDETLSQFNPLATTLRGDYVKILRHRAALLKSLREGLKDDFSWQIWSEKLARSGAMLIQQRVRLINALRPLAVAAHKMVAPEGKHLSMAYISTVQTGGHGEHSPDQAQPDFEDVEAVCATLLKQMNELREREIRSGQNLVGPHLDDLGLYLDGLVLRGFASHGEMWSVLLALRIATFNLLRAEQREPVLLLDDVFAELDQSRRNALADFITEAEQVIITAAVNEDLPPDIQGHRLRVELKKAEGSVVSEID